MSYLGNFAVDKTVIWVIPTNNSSGTEVDPSAGFANSDFKIWKDGGVTERSSASGITVTSTFDGETGYTIVSIDLSDNTDAGFYASGSEYIMAYTGSKTVDSQTPAFAMQWSIQNRASDVTQISGDAGAADNAEAFFDGTGYAGTNNVIPTVTTLTGHTAQTGDSFARIGAPVGASISADIADVPTVAEFEARTLVAASYFDPAADTVANVTTVATLTGHTAQTGDNFVRLGAPVGASISADIAAVQTDTTAIVADTNELQTDWTDGGRLDLIVDAILVDTGTTLDDHLTDIKGTGFAKDTHSLTDIEAFVDILDDVTSGNVKIATDVAAVLVDTADMQPKIGTPVTDVSADIAAVKAETALIVADTNELQTDWVDGGRLDLILDAILVDTGTTLDGKIDTVDTVVDAIKVVTDALPDAGALTSIAQADTMEGFFQITLRSDAAITTDRAAILTLVNADEGSGVGDYAATTDSQEAIADASTPPTAAAIADAVWDEAQGDHVAAGSFGLIASEIADILTDTNELQVDWTDGGRLDLIVDAILLDTGTTLDGKIDTIDGIVDAILIDTGTTLDDHLTDIKGTGFAKDTHSLTDIEAYVDLIDDGTSGLAKIATDVAAVLVDTADMQPKLGVPVADISADIAAIKAETALIVADTNELQTDWVDGGRLDLILDDILLDTGTTLDGKIDTIDGIVDAILLDTNELQTDWVDGGRLDLIVDAILVDTGTTLDDHLTDIKGTGFVKDTHSLIDIETFVDLIDDGTSGLAKIATDVAAILVDTADIQPKIGTVTDLGAGATLGDNLADMAGATFSSADDSLEAIRDRGDAAWATGAGTGLTALASGTAVSGTSSTIRLAAGETFANDELNGNSVKITSGTGAGQSRIITDYVGSTDTATVFPDWTTTPSSDSVYEIVNGSVNITVVSNVAEDLPTATALAVVDTVVDAILVDTADMQPKIGAPVTDLAADIAAVKVDTAATLVDTNELQTDWVNGGRLDLIIDAILVDTAEIGTSVGASISADIAAIQTDTTAIVADTNELQTDWVNGGRLDVILDAILLDTGTTLDGKINTIDGIVDAILVDTGTTLDGKIDTIDGIVDAILLDTAEIGTAGVGLTDLGGMSTTMKAQVNTEVDGSIETYHLDHLLAANYNPTSPPGVATALLNELVENDGGEARFTANALEQAPSGGASALDIADAVWDESQGDHIAAGSFGEMASEIASILIDTSTTLDGKINTIDSAVDAILTDTGTAGVVVNAATQNAIADALLDRADGVEPVADGTERTVREALRIILASTAGKLSGVDTDTPKFRDLNDTKDVISATVNATGRTSVTITDT